MTGQVVCFISAKGGSGKTVTSSALGTFLASLGFKILLVDTDAATNGLTLLYLEQLLGRRRQNSKVHIADVGLFEAEEDKTVTRIEIDQNLHLVPAAFTMKDTGRVDEGLFDNALSRLLRNKDEYDFVFLDAQAGTDGYANISARFADQCVIVSEYDPVSAQGIERLKILFSTVIDSSSTWILFNKVLPEFANAIGEGLSIARYLTPIPWDADVVRAFARCDLAIDMLTPNPYTLAVSQVAFSLFPDETGDAIESWRGSALSNVVSPVRDRLAELEKAEKILRQAELKRQFYKARIFALGFIAFGAICIVTYVVLPEVSAWYLAAIAIGGSFAMSIIVDLFNPQFDFLDQYETVTDASKLIDEEKRKLRTALDAAESLFKHNRSGYYERRRRKPKPEPAATTA